MTQEQKEKLEQAAKDYIKPFAHQLHLGADEGLIMDLVGFAQTILDNPGEWGLYPPDPALAVLAEGYHRLQAQNDRYRKALERIADPIGYMESQLKEGEQLNGMAAIRILSDGNYLNNIAKEALKQEEQ